MSPEFKNGIPITMFKGAERSETIVFYSQKVVDGEFIEIKPIYFNSDLEMTDYVNEECYLVPLPTDGRFFYHYPDYILQ